MVIDVINKVFGMIYENGNNNVYQPGQRCVDMYKIIGVLLKQIYIDAYIAYTIYHILIWIHIYNSTIILIHVNNNSKVF